MKISDGGSMVLKNNLSVTADALVWNDGFMNFKNDHETTLDINTILNGDGIYHVIGSADCMLKGDGAAISSLSIESGQTVWLDNNLSVSKALTLESGHIDVADQATLKILDTSADAVVFTDTYNNTSFIRGTLLRNTVPDTEYTFPVGTVAEGFHPFTVGGVSSAGYVGVAYKPDFDNTWNLSGTNTVSLEDVGGWQVTTASEGVTFMPGLSLYDTDGVMNDKYAVFYTADPDASSPDFSLDNNTGVIDNGTYLSSKTTYRNGLFAVSKIETQINKEGDAVPKLVNLMVQDGLGRKTFEVPGIYNYKTVVLSVYNRLGNLVYESSDYANDFDSRDYRAGTYYYELTLVTKEDRKILSRNIIEIMEHN